MADIDNSFKEDGKPFRRFYLERLKDETGISRTGRVLEGVVAQDGKVITQWRPPHSTIGIYNSIYEFRTIHVDCHPSCNRIVWIDAKECSEKNCSNDARYINGCCAIHAGPNVKRISDEDPTQAFAPVGEK